ncbi:MAG: septum formation initiator family protein [Mogibacterium sp.]|nr:septum formation initiator family protein [Mogibacterium sp.]
MAKKNRKKFDTTEIRLTDEELALRMEQRYKVRTTQLRRRKTITLLVFLVVFAILATMCGKDIVRLKAENIALKKQQVALEKQRDELKEELTNVDDPEYIREQARKQLNLLNPGEILFLFDDGNEQTEDAGGSDG